MKTKSIIAVTLLLWVLLLLVTLAQAATYWVRASGGTATTNCASASGSSDPGFYIRSMRTVWANCTINAGDTINVYGGLTYAEAVIDNALDNVPAGGSSYTSPVTIQGVNGTPTFTGTSGVCQRFNVPAVVHYYVFKNMIWSGCTAGGNAPPSNHHHIKFENMDMGNNPDGAGVIDYYGDSLWITGSHFHDCYTSAPSIPNVFNNWHCIYIEGPNALIENNEIDHAKWGFGVHIYSGGPDTTNAIIRNNWIHDIGVANDNGSVSCVTINNGDNAQVYNNICSHSQQGFGVNGRDNTRFYNNTVADYGSAIGNGCVVGGSGQCAAFDIYGSTNTKVQNNIIQTSSGVNYYTLSASGQTIDHNLCPSAGTGCVATGNPQFIVPGSNFHLQAGSPAINTGIGFGAPFNFDKDGLPRPSGQGFDIGAYEYTGDIAPPSNQLVLALPLDAGSGTTAIDVSGFNNNGTLAPGADWDSAGKYGKAVSFDGVSGAIGVVNSPSLNLTNGMTLEAWVKPSTTASSFTSVITKGDPYFLYAGSDPGYCGVASAALGGVSGSTVVCDTGGLPLNVYSHLAVTYDGVTLAYYRNGVVTSTVPSIGGILQSGDAVQIGASTFGEYFTGSIDEVRVYNYARTQAQIQADMNAPLVPGGNQNFIRLNPASSLTVGAASSITFGAN